MRDGFKNFLGFFSGRYTTTEQRVEAEIFGERLAAFFLSIGWAVRGLPNYWREVHSLNQNLVTFSQYVNLGLSPAEILAVWADDAHVASGCFAYARLENDIRACAQKIGMGWHETRGARNDTRELALEP